MVGGREMDSEFWMVLARWWRDGRDDILFHDILPLVSVESFKTPEASWYASS